MGPPPAELRRRRSRVSRTARGSRISVRERDCPASSWPCCGPTCSSRCIEPLLRRATFLTEAVQALGLTNVVVLRARAEEHPPTSGYDVVLARAVAPLDKLAGWALPLLREGGRLLALKGETAAEELDGAAPALAALGATSSRVVECAIEGVEAPTIVVEVVAGRRRPPKTNEGFT